MEESMLSDQSRLQPKQQPPQQQTRRPGIESEMTPRPKAEDPDHIGSHKLRDKVALIQAATAASAERSPLRLLAKGPTSPSSI
jgi:hypothetical protein